MKKIVLFENACELVNAFSSARQIGDESPYIPNQVKLVSDIAGGVRLVGEGSDGFQLADDITLDNVIYALAERSSVRLEMT